MDNMKNTDDFVKAREKKMEILKLITETEIEAKELLKRLKQLKRDFKKVKSAEELIAISKKYENIGDDFEIIAF